MYLNHPLAHKISFNYPTDTLTMKAATSGVLLLILFLSGGCFPINGLNLIGPCPNVSPTMDKGNFYFSRIIYSIPLSGVFTPSHFFREKDDLINLLPQLIERDKNFKGLYYIDRLTDHSVGHFVWDSVENIRNRSFTLKGRIVDFSLKERLCPDDLIEENFRMWTEDQLALMWTCKEGDNGYGIEHDEALIVYLNFMTHDAVESFEPKVRELVKKYLGDHLGKLIDLNHSIQVARVQKYPRAYCSTTTTNLEILLAWIVISLVVLILIAIRTHLYLTQDK